MSDPLTPEQVRVLGCLVEKEQTTPEQYPLSTNALVLACNQRTNRDPVVDYDDRVVDTALLDLRLAGLARTVRPTGSRAHKHRHVLHEAWGVDREELAVLAVLMLRGPQTPGELRARTDRYVVFTELGEVEAVLANLARRQPPLVANLGRRAGQSQDRWAHTLAGDPAALESGDGAGEAAGVSVAAPPSGPADVTARIERLEAAVARIAEELGISLEDAGFPDRSAQS